MLLLQWNNWMDELIFYGYDTITLDYTYANKYYLIMLVIYTVNDQPNISCELLWFFTF